MCDTGDNFGSQLCKPLHFQPAPSRFVSETLLSATGLEVRQPSHRPQTHAP